MDLVAGRAPVGMTPRRVLWLAGQLGEDSALVASQRGGGEQRRWTAQMVLLAGVFNALVAANYQRANGKGRKPTFLDPPRPRRVGRESRMAAHISRGLASQRDAESA